MHDVFQTKDTHTQNNCTHTQNNSSPDIQLVNLEFFITEGNGSGVLDTENAGLPTVSSLDDHDPMNGNKGSTVLEPLLFDMVHSR